MVFSPIYIEVSCWGLEPVSILTEIVLEMIKVRLSMVKILEIWCEVCHMKPWHQAQNHKYLCSIEHGNRLD